jgi:hypothetical protein
MYDLRERSGERYEGIYGSVQVLCETSRRGLVVWMGEWDG